MKERRREGGDTSHTYISGHTSDADGLHARELWRNAKRRGTRRGRVHQFSLPGSQTHTRKTLWILWQSAGKCVALMDQRKMSFGRATWLICFLLPKEDDHLWDEAGNGSRLAADKACLPVGQISIVPNWPSIQRCSVTPRNTHTQGGGKEKEMHNVKKKKKVRMERQYGRATRVSSGSERWNKASDMIRMSSFFWQNSCLRMFACKMLWRCL